ncbi:MAG: heme-binding protein, partial [Pseudomonadota bacterium]
TFFDLDDRRRLPSRFHAATPATASEYRGYETPSWNVEKRDGPFELRLYQPYLAAEVTLRGNPDTALRKGFQTLAGFIFGENEVRAKVAMTAPVTRQAAKIDMTAPVTRERSGDAWTVRFMMPSEYTEATLPRPKNSNIQIVTVNPGRRAVHRFNGLASQTRLTSAEAKLRTWITMQGWDILGAPDAAWFDDPFTLPWRRRNEVSLPVRLT